MINLDFSLAIALPLFLFLGATLILWVSLRVQENKKLILDDKFIWVCSICTYTYINTRQDAITVCPRCGNYNKK